LFLRHSLLAVKWPKFRLKISDFRGMLVHCPGEQVRERNEEDSTNSRKQHQWSSQLTVMCAVWHYSRVDVGVNDHFFGQTRPSCWQWQFTADHTQSMIALRFITTQRVCIVRTMPCGLCHADYAMRTMPCGLCHGKISVRLSHAGILSTVTHILKVFSLSVSPTILVFPYQTGLQYSDGDPHNGGIECREGVKIAIFDQYLASSRKWWKIEP